MVKFMVCERVMKVKFALASDGLFVVAFSFIVACSSTAMATLYMLLIILI